MGPLALSQLTIAPYTMLGLGAYALIIGGIALLICCLGDRDGLVSKRIGLVAGSLDNSREALRDAKATLGGLFSSGPGTDPVRREIIRRLAKLGIAPNQAEAVFFGVRFIALGALGAFALMLAPHLAVLNGFPLRSAAFTLAAGALGWYCPVLVIRDMARTRAGEVAAGLPDALDLLVICAETGLALEDGIERVAAELKIAQPAIAEELLLTAADLKVLPNSEQALGRLAERVDLAPVRALVATLSQTMRYGTPLAQAMRVVAAQMRNDALLQLEERANKLPALMTIPMIVFIIPTIYLILGGPAALQIIDTLMR